MLATKSGEHGFDMGYPRAAGSMGGRSYIRRAVEESLRRLRTDYIDLYQYHRPDGRTPIAETMAALDELVREGKVRYIGHSNFPGWMIAEAACIAAARPTPHPSIPRVGIRPDELNAEDHMAGFFANSSGVPGWCLAAGPGSGAWRGDGSGGEGLGVRRRARHPSNVPMRAVAHRPQIRTQSACLPAGEFSQPVR